MIYLLSFFPPLIFIILGFFSYLNAFIPTMWEREYLDELWLRGELYDPFYSYLPTSESSITGHLNTCKGSLGNLLVERLKTFERFGYIFDVGFRIVSFKDTVRGIALFPRATIRVGGLRLLWEPVARVGTDSLYPRYRKGKVLGLDFDRANISYERGGIYLLVGRERVIWGGSPYTPLAFSGYAPAFDMIFLSYVKNISRVGRFMGQYGATQLNSFSDSLGEIKRYLVFHRIDFSPSRFLRVGFAEIVLFGGINRSFDLYYLNPWIVYYPYQWNRGRIKTDNFLWVFDGKLTYKKNSLYGSLLVDDFQLTPPSDKEPNHLGISVVFEKVDPPLLGKSLLLLSYQAMTRWALTYRNMWERFHYLDFPISHPLGPDFDEILLSLVNHRTKDLDLLLRVSKVRKGEGSLWSEWPQGKFPKDNFLYGVVESSWSYRVGLRLFLETFNKRLGILEFLLGGLQMKNFSHIKGLKKRFVTLSLTFALNW